jgi:uncharacterized protein (TIRG00374 family)
VLAAALTFAIVMGLNDLVRGPMPESVTAVFSRPVGAGLSSPFPHFLSSDVAFITIVGFGSRYNLQAFTWTCLIVNSVAQLLSGDATLISLIATFLLGRAVAFGWRYARGAVNNRPSGLEVATSLAAAGISPLAVSSAGRSDEARFYEVTCADGELLDVSVLDRDQQTAGLFYRLYRRVRLRVPAQRRNLLSMRRSMEQEALMAYAVRAAGIRTPELVAVRELGPDASMLAYQSTTGRRLSTLPAEELTDDLLTKVWRLLAGLQRHQLVHRRLSPDNLLLDADDELWLLDLRVGEIAANDIQMRLDTAELLASMSICFGPERTVRIASEVLGTDAIGAALPMLQPVVLTRATRTALRRASGLLHQVRQEILAFHPKQETEPIHLERLRPRTLLLVAAVTIGLYTVVTQLSKQSVTPLLNTMSWSWTLAVFAASASTYVGAGLSLTGFVPERLKSKQVLNSQLAASFVSVVTPASVGGITVNTRYLQRAGIEPGLAVASVGASQIVGFIVHFLLILLFVLISGTEHGTRLAPSNTLIAILLTVALIVLIVTAIKPLRQYALSKLRPFFSGVLPRMLDVVQDPMKLAEGIGGAVLLSMSNVIALWASVQAFGGGHGVTFSKVAVIFLAGQAVGSVIPTPGGIGSVDAALIGGLGTIGTPGNVAAAAVLLFRLATLWLPVLPGWIAFNYMRRREPL